jgi:hypothetical protein
MKRFLFTATLLLLISSTHITAQDTLCKDSLAADFVRFMEATPFHLPYTQLDGTISNSMQLFLPATDARAKKFLPDIMPSYDDYLRYHFDFNTELLWLLDKIKSE